MSALTPVGPIRDAFLRLASRNEVTAWDLAYRLGWERVSTSSGRRVPDVDRVRQSLGLVKQPSRGQNYVRQSIREQTAVAIVEAMGLDPVDVGL